MLQFPIKTRTRNSLPPEAYDVARGTSPHRALLNKAYGLEWHAPFISFIVHIRLPFAAADECLKVGVIPPGADLSTEDQNER